MFFFNLDRVQQELFKSLNKLDFDIFIEKIYNISHQELDSTATLSNSNYYILTSKQLNKNEIYFTLNKSIIFKANSDSTHVVYNQQIDNNKYYTEIIILKIDNYKNKVADSIYPAISYNSYLPKLFDNISFANFGKRPILEKSTLNLNKYNILDFLNQITIRTSQTDYTISFENLNLSSDVIPKIKNLYLNISVFDYYSSYNKIISDINSEFLDENNLQLYLTDFNYLYSQPQYVIKLDLKTILTTKITSSNLYDSSTYQGDKLLIGFRFSLKNNLNVENLNNISSGLYIKVV